MAFRAAWDLEDPRYSGLGLWNVGAAVLAFTLLYWICDRRGKQRWASLVRPAGSNTLLTYLLPDLWYFLLGTVGFTYFDTHFAFGWTGVIKSVVFTLLMLALRGVHAAGCGCSFSCIVADRLRAYGCLSNTSRCSVSPKVECRSTRTISCVRSSERNSRSIP